MKPVYTMTRHGVSVNSTSLPSGESEPPFCYFEQIESSGFTLSVSKSVGHLGVRNGIVQTLYEASAVQAGERRITYIITHNYNAVQ